MNICFLLNVKYYLIDQFISFVKLLFSLHVHHLYFKSKYYWLLNCIKLDILLWFRNAQIYEIKLNLYLSYPVSFIIDVLCYIVIFCDSHKINCSICCNLNHIAKYWKMSLYLTFYHYLSITTYFSPFQKFLIWCMWDTAVEIL